MRAIAQGHLVICSLWMRRVAWGAQKTGPRTTVKGLAGSSGAGSEPRRQAGLGKACAGQAAGAGSGRQRVGLALPLNATAAERVHRRGDIGHPGVCHKCPMDVGQPLSLATQCCCEGQCTERPRWQGCWGHRGPTARAALIKADPDQTLPSDLLVPTPGLRLMLWTRCQKRRHWRGDWGRRPLNGLLRINPECENGVPV